MNSDTEPCFITAHCGTPILIDREDYALLSQRRWHLSGKGKHKYAYAYYSEGKKQCFLAMHRFLAKAQTGMEVDHKNRNSLDNRKINLRVCTRSQNIANSHVNRQSKTGYRGVLLLRGRFSARIVLQGRLIQLGSFENAFDAARAYDVLALKHHGEFAITNFKYFEVAA